MTPRLPALCVVTATLALSSAAPATLAAASTVAPTTNEEAAPQLVLGGRACGVPRSAEGGGITAVTGTAVAGASGRAYGRVITSAEYKPIRLELGFGMDQSVYQWIDDLVKAKGTVRDGTLVYPALGGAPAAGLDFKNAYESEVDFPACDASSEEPGYITVVLVPQSTRDVAPPTVPPGAAAKQTKWRRCDFRLEIDGLDCSGVSKVESIWVKANLSAHVASGAGASTQENSEVKITLPDARAAAWWQWRDDFLIKGNHDIAHERNGRLVFLSPDGKRELMRLNFVGLGILGLDRVMPDAATKGRNVVATLYCASLRLDASGVPASGAPVAAGVPAPNGKGEFGKTYRMRSGEPLHFTLRGATYTVAPVTVGRECFTTAAGEKSLVLHFDLENPGPAERLVRYDMLPISVIDAARVERPQQKVWGLEGKNTPAAFPLAAGGRVSVFAVVTVPARGEPSTILVRSNRANDGPDLPYDVHGNVPPLPAPFADPADPTGATAREEVPAEPGAAYPCDYFAVNLRRMGSTTEALGGVKPGDGERYFVCTLVVRNQTPAEHLLRFDMLQPTLLSAAKERLVYKGMLLEDDDRPVAQPLGPGREMPVRLYFLVPKGVEPRQLLLQERRSRRYVYPVEG